MSALDHQLKLSCATVLVDIPVARIFMTALRFRARPIGFDGRCSHAFFVDIANPS